MAAKTKSKKTDLKAEITNAYFDYVLTHGERPASVYHFTKSMDLDEGQFYEYFGDFDSIDAEFWETQMKDQVNKLEGSAEWAEFSSREKLLTFYYVFFEHLKTKRSIAMHVLNRISIKSPQNIRELDALRKTFEEWIKHLLRVAEKNGEIASRMKVNDYYNKLFWLQFMFLLDYWKKDRSAGFESTDEAIEKSVHLSFDLIEKNALDSALDFGKFIFQNR